MATKVTYVGYDNTNCTRALAAMSEQRLIAPHVTLWQENDSWFLQLLWNEEDPSEDQLHEIENYTSEYALRKLDN